MISFCFRNLRNIKEDFISDGNTILSMSVQMHELDDVAVFFF